MVRRLPRLLQRANGGGNSLSGRSVVLYGQRATSSTSSERIRLPVPSCKRALPADYHLGVQLRRPDTCSTPLEAFTRGLQGLGLKKVQAWSSYARTGSSLLYGQADASIISEMMGCGAIPPEVELYLDLKTMLQAAGKVIRHIERHLFHLFPFAEAADIARLLRHADGDPA